MGRLEKLTIGNKEILRIDYTNCNQDQMIELMLQAKHCIEAEAKPVWLLCEFNNTNRLTPRFMRQLETDYKGVEHLIVKNAVTGLSEIQRWILKGVNIWTQREIVHFDTREAAIKFLTD